VSSRQGESVLAEIQRREASVALANAERACEPIVPLSETYSHLDLDDAYEIQRLGIAKRVDGGEVVRGHKVGLTSRAMQQQFGVSEPDYGHLMSDMFLLEGAAIPVDELCAPRVEVEVAFVLGEKLAGPGVNVADVLRATAFLLPALEVIDSRIADWRITLADTIADNASSARVVLGGSPASTDAVDVRLVGAVLRKNGEVVETGASGAVLGNPASAVCWLANKLAAFGISLEAGQVVMPGSCTRAIPVGAGDQVRADLDGLGFVSARFAKTDSVGRRRAREAVGT
jgi:2-keto-4-pentenoate hydratase